MRSKTSLCNMTVFRKNLTRFAPLWAVYALILLVVLTLEYTDGYSGRELTQRYWYAYNFGRKFQETSAIATLFYALAAAELLFGDLFNSRMCNALHALPLNREGWMATNLLSGLAFSLIPTAVAALAAMCMLWNSYYENGWMLAWLWFAMTNLEYICFFGIAAFSVMCTGSRLTMAAGYGLLNFGTYIAYWLVDTLYTPLLYGVVTPTTLASRLSPINHMISHTYVKMENIDGLYRSSRGAIPEDLVLRFTLSEQWWRLPVLAAVGILFALGALALYKRRDLECAGDAVAFKFLAPVFQVLCAVFVMAASQYAIYMFMGFNDLNYLALALSLVLGWFVGKMLLERSTRVFQLRNWKGLALLALAMVLSLTATHFDILGISRRLPDREEIVSVDFDSLYTSTENLELPEQIDDMLRLHALAIDDPVADVGTYVLDEKGEFVPVGDIETFEAAGQILTEDGTVISSQQSAPAPVKTYRAGQIRLRYMLKNGAVMTRRYNVWVDSQAGQLARQYLSRWEHVNNGEERGYLHQAAEGSVLDQTLATFAGMYIMGMEGEKEPDRILTVQDARSFIEAVKADCAAGNMAQDSFFHKGVFLTEYTDRTGYTQKDETSSLHVSLNGVNAGWSINVYPDSENCVSWLRENGLLAYEVRTEE